MEYAEHVAVLANTHPALAAEISGFRTLESVLAWMPRREIAMSSMDIVFQDEFSHDFLVPLGPGQGWLAFGIT